MERTQVVALLEKLRSVGSTHVGEVPEGLSVMGRIYTMEQRKSIKRKEQQRQRVMN